MSTSGKTQCQMSGKTQCQMSGKTQCQMTRMDSERTERFERSETGKSLITNGIEFRIFENSQTLPKRLIEKEKRKTKKNENYLIEYFQKCENDCFQKLKPIKKIERDIKN